MSVDYRGLGAAVVIEAGVISGELGLTAYERRRDILRYLRKLKYRLRRGHLKIGIFGAGGTGKTTLANLLSGKLDLGSRIGPYEESYEVDRISLPGNLVCTMLVAPGQEHRVHTW